MGTIAAKLQKALKNSFRNIFLTIFQIFKKNFFYYFPNLLKPFVNPLFKE